MYFSTHCFSKILFPGLRIGWVLCDKNLIDRLESVKRCTTIHVSFLDQGILYDYLQNGAFEKYIKKTRKFYGDKFNFAKQCVQKYIKCDYILGDGENMRRRVKKFFVKSILYSWYIIFFLLLLHLIIILQVWLFLQKIDISFIF